MTKKPMTYAESGVDIHKEDQAVGALASALGFVREGIGQPLGGIGHFAGLIEFGDHALCLCTDGVGSKVEIANELGVWNTVGIDCMAMNVNDALCVGAEPVAFVDYLAIEDPEPEQTAKIGEGLQEACRQANVTLVGGETATLPGIIKGFDLAGTCLAIAKKDELVTGEKIESGDVLIGIASTGIHSNGYTLARAVVTRSGLSYTDPWPVAGQYEGQRLGDVYLTPTAIYTKPIMALLKAGHEVHGLSHITGSGLRKLKRIAPEKAFHITSPLPVLPVFDWIQAEGGIEHHEMYKTFNMGMGFVVVVPKGTEDEALRILRANTNLQVDIVGHVADGTGVHHPIGGEHQ